MLILSRFISWLAIRLLRQEWVKLQGQLVEVYRQQVGSTHCQPTLRAQQLLISGEDHRFFNHGGIDVIAVARAIWRSVVRGRPEGASTIEMQIIRVVSGRFERTIRRKLREMALATLVAREIPKEALPALYLRIGYFGWRMTGFEAACRRVGVRANAMTPAETAELVARLKYPQPRFTPRERWDQIGRRARHLLHLHSRHARGETYARLAREAQCESV